MHGGSLASGHGLIALVDGRATVEVAPAAGGSIASFYWSVGDTRYDWLRPAAPEAVVRADAGAMGCFPLVPYSNRIRDGRFAFSGRTIELPSTPDLDPHFEHGHGWRQPWSVAEMTSRSLVLTMAHMPDAWPWHYEARQDIAVTRDGALHVNLGVTNLDETPMPVGLGLHPYFPKTPATQLTASVNGVWAVDADVLPTELVTPHGKSDPRLGMPVSAVDLDNVFTEWSGTADVIWPERHARLRLAADGPLAFLVVYTPAAEPYFCAEPVSNATDAFNLAAAGRDDTGMAVLSPGQSLYSTVRFTPELLA